MKRGRALQLYAALGATALALPPPGTTSRERGFCDAWVSLDASERYEVVARDAATPRDAGARARVADALTTECRNWHLLMDFEVRAIADHAQR